MSLVLSDIFSPSTLSERLYYDALQFFYLITNQHSTVSHFSFFQSVNGILDSLLCHGELDNCWLDIVSRRKSKQVNDCAARSCEGSLDGSSEADQSNEINGGVLFGDGQGVYCAVDGEEFDQAAMFCQQMDSLYKCLYNDVGLLLVKVLASGISAKQQVIQGLEALGSRLLRVVDVELCRAVVEGLLALGLRG